MALAYSPNGDRLASGSNDDTVRLWDPKTGTELEILKGHTGDVRAVAFSPDGGMLASGDGNDNEIRLWDGHDGEHILTLVGHQRDVTGLAFSPDGSILASASDDRTVGLWDMDNGAESTESTDARRTHDVRFSSCVFAGWQDGCECKLGHDNPLVGPGNRTAEVGLCWTYRLCCIGCVRARWTDACQR